MESHKLYNCHGVLCTEIEPIINIGDIVEYIDTGNLVDNKGRQTKIKLPIYGIWDGEKVQFNDKDKTIVFNKWWLKVVE